MSQLPPPPPAPLAPPSRPDSARRRRSLALVWAAVGGVLAVSLVVLLAARPRNVAVSESPSPTPATSATATPTSTTATPTPTSSPSPSSSVTPTTTASPTTTPSPTVTVTDDEEPIPGSGAAVFVGGGVARVPVPRGWEPLGRGDRPDDPGGYSESAVIANAGSRVTLGVYLLEAATDPAAASTTAAAAARRWARDGERARAEPARELTPIGAAAAAAVRYRYVRGSSIEGEVIAAVRPDGTTLLVFVDVSGRGLGSVRGVWDPVREFVLRSFGT